MDSRDTEGGLLLVIHGSETKRESLCRCLQEAGHTPIPAPNGLKGLESLRVKSPDLVILDIATPETDVEQILSTLKADKATQTIPVILLAPPSETETVDRFLSQGADDFLLAPYSPTLLKSQVRDYLQIGRRRRQEQVRHEREDLMKIERDVQIARTIQLGFLPSELPQPEGWEVAARFRPAREVAGDFYDAFTLSQGRRVALVIADVCDKGVGAALFMALFRSLYRAYSQQHYSMRWTDLLDDNLTRGAAAKQHTAPSTGTTALKNAINLTNDYMVRNHADANMFATTFFGVLDPATGGLAYVNGGHNPPLVVGRTAGDPNSPIAVKARLKPTGPAPGLFPDVDYKLGQVVLEPGDMLFTYTDGVTDAKDPQGVLFGEERMVALVQESAPTASELLDRVDEALHTHIGEASQFDDITMLAVHRKEVVES